MNIRKLESPVSEPMDKPKKILHLIQSLDNGGCENMLLRTLPLLNQQGLENVIVTLKTEGSLADQMKSKGIPLYSVYQKHLLDIPSYIRLFEIIRNQRPQLIITYLLHADIIGRLFLQSFGSAKVIPFLRTTYNHPRYLLARIFERVTKSLVKHYLANSQAVKYFYTHTLGVKPEKITVIPNGIDADYFNSIPRDENLRESFGIKPKDTAIICVANLHPNKGHQYLLEAFETVFQEQQNIHLLIVGDGEEKENLLNQTSNYSSKNNIHFLGRRNDVPQLLKISDIFVLPTLFEGMSNAIMEAMASSLPIITTDIPENRALIEHKASGMLTPPENTQSLSTVIQDLLNNTTLRENFGKEAKKTIEERFSLEKIADQLKNFYSSLS
jgi:glycosyltransferase involved in cell wall biosynthesis